MYSAGNSLNNWVDLGIGRLADAPRNSNVELCNWETGGSCPEGGLESPLVDVLLLLLMALGIMVVGLWLILDYETRCARYLATFPWSPRYPHVSWSRRDLDEAV